jgi:hypothetical protein
MYHNSRHNNKICITIINTIIHHILHIYTNDAYIFYDNDILAYDTYLQRRRVDGIYGIYGIKDTYVVCKYDKKTVLKLGFIWVWVLDTYLQRRRCVVGSVR